MTLCIAIKEKENICFASDSCISFIKDEVTLYSNVGIKVLSLPYTLKDINSGKEYEGDIGICISGSVLNSFVFKETLTEIFKNIQFIPKKTNLTLENIMEIIFNSYKILSYEICNKIEEKGIVEIILAGKLPDDNSLRAFKLSTDKITNTHTCNEILHSEGDYEFIGSGEKQAANLLQIRGDSRINRNTMLNLLQIVIEDPAVKGVDGNIQYGEFNANNEFVIHGIIKHDNNGLVYYNRGFLDLNLPEFQMKDDGFYLSYQYLIAPPFIKTIEEE